MGLLYIILPALLAFCASYVTATDEVILCYYGSSWETYRTENGKVRASDIDPYICTDIMHTSAGIFANGTVISLDPWLDLPDGLGKEVELQWKKIRDSHREALRLRKASNTGEKQCDGDDLRRRLIDIDRTPQDALSNLFNSFCQKTRELPKYLQLRVQREFFESITRAEEKAISLRTSATNNPSGSLPNVSPIIQTYESTPIPEVYTRVTRAANPSSVYVAVVATPDDENAYVYYDTPDHSLSY